jgi:DNA-binding response OmpR family regulator
MSMPRRALIVEAEPRTCKLLEEILLSAGIDAVTMAKTAEAQRCLQEGKFDVVLVDLSLWPAEGLELTRRIRGAGFNRTTPIVVIGDGRQRDTLSRGFAAGASFLIYKPIDRLRLSRLIQVTQGAIDHERRRFQRLPVRAKVRLRVGGSETEGETIDLSMNGMLVKAPRVFPSGSIVEVALFLGQNPKPVLGRGSIMRVIGADRMGIQLDGLSLAESQRLQEHLLPLVTK